MATTDAVKVMARKRKETHERLARGIGHQPTLDMLAQSKSARAANAITAVRWNGSNFVVRIVAPTITSQS
jgi:hypothetical protein